MTFISFHLFCPFMLVMLRSCSSQDPACMSPPHPSVTLGGALDDCQFCVCIFALRFFSLVIQDSKWIFRSQLFL